MNNYIVELRYPNGSFETRTQADDEAVAKRQALAEAQELGFTQPVTKVIIIGCRQYKQGERA